MASTSVGPCVDEVIGSALAISRRKSNQVGKHQMSEDGITDLSEDDSYDRDEFLESQPRQRLMARRAVATTARSIGFREAWTEQS